MKQTASHSQTPTFVKNESNTKPVLYQHPTPENTVQYKSSGLAPAALIVILIGTVIISGFTSCSANSHQTATQVEHIVKAGVKP